MSGVVSVGAAAASIAIAGASVAEAGLTIGSVLAITGAVGATVGAIGTLTGNKTLQIGGMALGAVGAIGGIAGMAGAFAGAGSLAGEAGTAAGGIDSEIANWSSYGATAATDAGNWAAGASQDVIGAITGTTPPPDTLVTAPMSSALPGTPPLEGPGSMAAAETVAGSSPNVPGSAPGSAAPATNAVPAAPGGATTGTPAPGDSVQATTPGPYQSTVDPVTGVGNVSLKPGAAQPVTPLETTPAGSWDSIMAWVEKHPSLALSGVTAASSFLSGAFNPKTPAEVNALNASANRNQAEVGLIGAQTGLINQQLANASAVPTATRTRTNPGTGGLISQPRAA